MFLVRATEAHRSDHLGQPRETVPAAIHARQESRNQNKASMHEQKRALIEGATNLLHDVLGKNKSTTVVTIDEVDTDNWGIGGVPVTEIRKNAAAKK